MAGDYQWSGKIEMPAEECLEKWSDEKDQLGAVNAAMQISCAMSLKRIADVLEGTTERAGMGDLLADLIHRSRL